MSLIDRNQTAVYWAPASLDSFGKHTFGVPVEVDCRWQDSVELVRDGSGAERCSVSKVFPDRALSTGGFLYLGELTDLSDAEKADPKTVTNASEIIAVQDIPSLDLGERVYTAWLCKKA